jgi:hypothetical protein
MVWFIKSKNKKGGDKRAEEGSNRKSSKANQSINEGSLRSQRPGSADIRAQALANVRKAKEHIGEETIQKIAAAMQKKQQSAFEQARAKIHQSDADRVAEEILAMLETRH